MKPEQPPEKQNNGVAIYHKSRELPSTKQNSQKRDNGLSEELLISNEARRSLYSLYNRIASGEKSPYLLFDLDGVVVEGGVETAFNETTLDQYIEKNKESIAVFRKKIKRLSEFGFKVGIVTGRGVDFTERAVNEFFPEGSVTKAVCEGGAAVISYEEKNGEIQKKVDIAESVDKESMEILASSKEQISKYVNENLGGHIEPGKWIVLSYNPPKGQPIGEFYQSVYGYIANELGVADKLAITHSGSAVDITPLGADKLPTMNRVLGSDLAVYFGDAKSDEAAMKRSAVSVVPGNALASTKEQARRGTFGLVADKKELAGIVDALNNIELYFRFARKKYMIRKEPDNRQPAV